MTLKNEENIFCGVLPSGTGNAFMQFVMGKVVISSTRFTLPEQLLEWFSEGGTINLIEPLMIHRVPAMMQDPKTGQQQMVITHQFIEDPYWPIRREIEVPFRLSHFLSVRLMDLQNAKDLEEVGRYENSLTQFFAKSQGLVLSLKK
jgi:hypothetical protein